jgi:hypothetical protein
MRTVRAISGLFAALGLIGAPAHARQLVDPASLMTTPVWVLEGARPVAQGTGFFFGIPNPDQSIGSVFLVTNFHVVTGHAPQHDGAGRGDRIRIVIHEDPTNPARVRHVELPLYDVDGRPAWIASESFGAADVVLLPVPPRAYEGARLYVFTEDHTQVDIRIRPTSGATLLGYPFGFYDTSHFLPIWKTGHVASEPDVDFEHQPAFLVDVSAFPGMSGSPVLAVSNGIYEARDGSMRTGRVLRLLGIFSAMPVVRQQTAVDPSGYSSETRSVETSLQLGYVWKAALIADIARGYRPRR